MPYESLLHHLQLRILLTEAEAAAVRRTPVHVEMVRAKHDLVRAGDRPSRSCIILDGYGYTYKMTDIGRRQIMAVHLPGDMPDLHSLHLSVMDNGVGVLTDARVCFIRHEAVMALCADHPRIAGALWRSTLVDGAIFREWLVNVGQREALGRLAHLFCEILTRMQAIGLAESNCCFMPMTQGELGDATGMSNVHVNRTLQALRQMGLIKLAGNSLEISDPSNLADFCGFEPSYLHLEDNFQGATAAKPELSRKSQLEGAGAMPAH